MLEIGNKQARLLWLTKNLLAKSPVGDLDLMQTIKDLGFVQIDTIQNVVRAHHHILWSRNHKYRPKMIDMHLGRAGDLFEHFTHDASMIPTEYFPNWRRQFSSFAEYYDKRDWMTDLRKSDLGDELLERLGAEGPLSTEAFDTKIEGKKQMWERPPHKKMLDYLWYVGKLSTSHREKFRKHYDLIERVIPAEIYDAEVSDEDQIDWLCRAALDRLGVATPAEIRKFWAAVSLPETKKWVEETELQTVKIQSADGSWSEGFATVDLVDQLSALQKPTSKLRLLNPFDPAIRDRNRLKRLFGFDYTIEIFVPAEKRIWGYYVYPILQGDRFVGRIELKADRKTSELNVVAFWAEKKVQWTSTRMAQLNKELQQFCKIGGVENVVWQCEQP